MSFQLHTGRMPSAVVQPPAGIDFLQQPSLAQQPGRIAKQRKRHAGLLGDVQQRVAPVDRLRTHNFARLLVPVSAPPTAPYSPRRPSCGSQ